MILRLTKQAELYKIHDKLICLVQEFIKRTDSPYTLEEIMMAILQNIENPNFGVFIATDNNYNVCAYSLVQTGLDPCKHPKAYIWQYYSTNGNGKELAEKGLPIIKEWIKSIGINTLQLITKRDVKAFKKVLLDDDWEYGGTVMEIKLTEKRSVN